MAVLIECIFPIYLVCFELAFLVPKNRVVAYFTGISVQ